MKVTLLACTQNPEELIEKATRTCYDSKCNPDTRNEFLRGVMKRGHESVIEHASATFYVSGVSRALTHQLVRHRIASYSQVSQRYVKFDNFKYVIPPEIEGNKRAKQKFIDTMKVIRVAYENLVYLGIKAEDARFVLPNACETEITITMNFRALRNFFKLRLDSHAQWEIRELAKKMLELVKKEAPIIFEDFK